MKQMSEPLLFVIFGATGDLARRKLLPALYLGKETIQNLLVLRFANPIFEYSWNYERVEKDQITIAEELGVERRAAYYDSIGALRETAISVCRMLSEIT